MSTTNAPRYIVAYVRGEAARIIDNTTGAIVAYVDPAGAQRMADQRNRLARTS